MFPLKDIILSHCQRLYSSWRYRLSWYFHTCGKTSHCSSSYFHCCHKKVGLYTNLMSTICSSKEISMKRSNFLRVSTIKMRLACTDYRNLSMVLNRLLVNGFQNSQAHLLKEVSINLGYIIVFLRTYVIRFLYSFSYMSTTLLWLETMMMSFTISKTFFLNFSPLKIFVILGIFRYRGISI